MAPDWLVQAIDEDAPCGPDLELSDDEEFLDYFYDAEGRLPERYITTGQQLGQDGRPRDRLFDARDVDLAAERREIEALLRRSRDLRLLSLMARWEALAWKPADLADTVAAMAALVAEQGDAVHPALPARARDRRAAIEALTIQAHVIQPMHHLPMAGVPEATWRRWIVAQHQVEARPGEDVADPKDILSVLGERGRAPEVDALQGALSRMLTAARALHPTYLAPLTELLDGMLGLIAQARPDLVPPEPVLAPEEPTAEPDAPGGGALDPPAGSAPSPPPLPSATEPATRADARAALTAVQSYLAHHEPSSAAVLLVIQAGQLIGKPLVEALDTLLPKQAARAAVDFGPSQGFVLPMERLRALSAEIPATEDGTPSVPPPIVRGRPEAAAQLMAIAGYFRRSEPASPIPLLLDRARTWLERDFEGLLVEILSSTSAT